MGGGSGGASGVVMLLLQFLGCTVFMYVYVCI